MRSLLYIACSRQSVSQLQLYLGWIIVSQASPSILQRVIAYSMHELDARLAGS